MSSAVIDLTDSDDEGGGGDRFSPMTMAASFDVQPKGASSELTAKMAELNTNSQMHPASSASAAEASSSNGGKSAHVARDREVPAIEAPKESQSSKSFSSYEIKSLSKARMAKTRLPDLVQHDQNKGIHNSAHADIYKGYVQEHEEGHAGLEIVNEVDHQAAPPMDFAYIDGYETSEGVRPATLRVHDGLTIPAGCDCEGDECDPRHCACQKLHEQLAPNPWLKCSEYINERFERFAKSELRGKFAYNDKGKMLAKLIDIPSTPIWECNFACGCSERCKNRLVQYGRQIEIVLKKTENRGWGIFAGQDISKGSFIMTYGGQLITQDEVDARGKIYDKTGMTYCLDIEHYHIKFHSLINKYRAACRADPSLIPKHIPEAVFDEENDEKTTEMYLGEEQYDLVDAAHTWNMDDFLYSVDAGLWGNLSRYFNHSCDPNLNVFPVYTEERDLTRPFLAFFAKVDIPRGKELCFDYNMDQDDPPEGQEVGEVQIPVENGTASVSSVLRGKPAGTEIRIADANVLAQSSKPGAPEVDPGDAMRKASTLHLLKCQCGAGKKCRGFVFR